MEGAIAQKRDAAREVVDAAVDLSTELDLTSSPTITERPEPSRSKPFRRRVASLRSPHGRVAVDPVISDRSSKKARLRLGVIPQSTGTL